MGGMRKERKGSAARWLAFMALVVALPLTVLWLVPSLHTKHPALSVASMGIPALTILWPAVAIFAFFARVGSKRALDAALALLGIVGLVAYGLGLWPYARPDETSTSAAITVVVAHPRNTDDVARIDTLAITRQAQVVIYTGFNETTAQALTTSRLVETHSQWLRSGSTAIRSNLALTPLSAEGDPLVASADVFGTQWTFVPVDIPTPTTNATDWARGAQALGDTVAPRRSAPLVVTGSFGNNRHTMPATRLKTLGLVDAFTETGEINAPSWPVNGIVRPVLTFDQTWLGGGVHAVDHTRIALDGDDYLGFVITLTRS